MVLNILKGIFIFSIVIMIIYAIRHIIFAFNRMFGHQRLYYDDIISSDMPSISVLIPMYNEEKVLKNILDALLNCDYDRDRMEIIPINDSSTDETKNLIEEYHSRYEFIHPLHRDSPNRGKPAGLNDAMAIAEGDVIIVFDADYRPARNMLKQLALAFLNPEVGAVMGRVIPYNAEKNLLTRLLSLERSGGYQADQQARYNLRTIPQYGGTVGGFRKDVMLETGGFNPAVLAEDTELTYRFFTRGWKILYANSAECYEEVPETWKVRGRQVRRWSRGHNNVLFRYLFPLLFSRNMIFREKLDGFLLLFVYMVPFVFSLALIDSLALFFLGEMNIFYIWWTLLFIGAYNSFGNFAPFYEISAALLVDGIKKDVRLLPLMTFNFYFYLWNISFGFFDAILDLIFRRNVKWAKTERFSDDNKNDRNKKVKDN
jgi:cellulose synthase/poly-beta-1,6-N-acetylglucosamine synthase-like glycosyltransferase